MRPLSYESVRKKKGYAGHCDEASANINHDLVLVLALDYADHTVVCVQSEYHEACCMFLSAIHHYPLISSGCTNHQKARQPAALRETCYWNTKRLLPSERKGGEDTAAIPQGSGLRIIRLLVDGRGDLRKRTAHPATHTAVFVPRVLCS